MSEPPRPAADRTGLLSLVVPVLNESAVLATFRERASKALAALPGLTYEIVFVDDGSDDDSLAQLRAFAASDRQVGVVKLSRNFGHQVAITAGIDHAMGDCVVVIDADLQDPPEAIPEMVRKWREGYDVVYGLRRRRAGESWMKRQTAAFFYRLLNRITKVTIPVDVGDFRLMSRRAVNQLKRLREKDRFVRGLVSWIGFRQTGVVYDRDARYAGETKYPYGKMIKFAVDGITSFSTVPLKLVSWLGYATSALAFLYLVTVVIEKLLGSTVQGWASVMAVVLFLGGVQLIALGIIGEYLGRVFNELKPRPLYVVEDLIGTSFSTSPPPDA